jgi:16S rRNA (adenine1518-N6/adenine1519-N6)-dimethyltransferase
MLARISAPSVVHTAATLCRTTPMPRQRLGQHFLADAGWREKIARAIGVSPQGMEKITSGPEKHFCWIEIGAGHGEMTEHLVQSGAPVMAVELDPPLIERLQQLARTHANLTVVPGDVLETQLDKVAAGRRVRIYGNLPYYVTSPILHHLFRYAGQIDEAHLLIQLEVAQRLTAKPGSKSYGYLSVATQLYCRPDMELRLPPGAFRPPPEVDSALVTLRFPGADAGLGLSDVAGFLEFVKACFAQKRKTVANNLRAVAEPACVREILKQLKLREDARAEQLTVAELASLHRVISSGPSISGRDNRS